MNDLRLVVDERVVGDDRREDNLELDEQRIAGTGKAQVANIEQTRPCCAAGRIRVAGIGARGDTEHVERTRLIKRQRIEAVEFIDQAEIRDRRIAGVLDAQAVAERVARRCKRGGILTARDVDGGLLEIEQSRELDNRVGILMVEYADRAVGHAA